MKMQLRDILKLPAVDDKSVGGEFEFIHEMLNGGIEVSKESGVVGVEFCKRGDRLLRHDQYMERIRGFRVIKRHQRICLA